MSFLLIVVYLVSNNFLLLQVEIRILFVCFLVEAIESSSSFRGYLVDKFSLLYEVDILDTLTEVALIDFFTHHGLKNMLQLCKGEQFWKQLETQRLIVDAAANL